MRHARDDDRRLAAVNTLTYEIATPPNPVQLRCEFVFVDQHHSAQNGRPYAHPTPAWSAPASTTICPSPTSPAC